MRGFFWLLLLTSCLGWLLTAAPEAAAAVQSASSVLDAGAAPSAQSSCAADGGVSGSGSGGASAALECQSGAEAALEAAELQRLADAAIAAAPGGSEAPLCDESAASVGAVPFVPEANGGHFEALPCEALWALLAHSLQGDQLTRWRVLQQWWGSQAPPERKDGSPERSPVAREAPLALPARGEPCLLTREPRLGLVPRAGHARNVYRPPRSVG